MEKSQEGRTLKAEFRRYCQGYKKGKWRFGGKEMDFLRSYPAFVMGQVTLICFISFFISLVDRQDKGKPPVKFLTSQEYKAK